MKYIYIGKKVRKHCLTCIDIFMTQISDMEGNVKNTMCAKCKADRKAKIKNGLLKEDETYHGHYED